MPSKIIVPLQPGPSSGPQAWTAIGPAEGVFVRPGSNVTMPVGLAGVPPHVQSLVAGPDWALAEPNEPSAIARTALAPASTAAVGCLRIFISTPSIVDCRSRRKA